MVWTIACVDSGCIARHAGSMEDSTDRDRARIPAWDGDARFWKWYKSEVRMWFLAEKTDVCFSLVARLIQRLSGAARRAAMTLTDELCAVRRRDPVVGDGVEIAPAVEGTSSPASATYGPCGPPSKRR